MGEDLRGVGQVYRAWNGTMLRWNIWRKGQQDFQGSPAPFPPFQRGLGKSHSGNGVDERVPHLIHDGGRPCVSELENALNDRQLCRCRVLAAEGRPVVGEEAGADHVASAVDGPRHEGHLQQRRELVEVLDGRLRVNDSALVRELAVAAHKDVPADRLAEDLHAEDVGYELLGLPVHVRMDERHVVVAGNAVAERREPLLDALYDDLVGEAVADVLELLVRSRVG
mmetsp:Transcript_16423/g.38976  ORF Transcript_16423/g.38976 Transcript_16423/m.38976 type:complete len:225 (+) Transcript_16423:54-728(+)